MEAEKLSYVRHEGGGGERSRKVESSASVRCIYTEGEKGYSNVIITGHMTHSHQYGPWAAVSPLDARKSLLPLCLRLR